MIGSPTCHWRKNRSLFVLLVCSLVLGLLANASSATSRHVARASATTPLICATYLGGGASGDPFVEPANAVAVDTHGNIYIAGTTPAADFPTVDPVLTDQSGSDAFVAKFTPDCSTLVYATYLGGSKQDEAMAIAVDADGNAYVTGTTSSSDFLTANPLQPALVGPADAFITKLDPNGALVYSTYLGGANLETGHDIAIDTEGNAYIVGSTGSVNFPTQNQIQGPHFPFNGASSDAFVTKLSVDGQSLVYSTYLGGSAVENLAHSSIAVIPGGEVVVVGDTRSDDLEVVNAAQPDFGGGVADAFAARLNAAGTALVFWTYLGGSGNDEGWCVAIGDDSSAYIVGETGSADLPTLNAYQATYGGGPSDAFLITLRANGELALSTFLGGSNSDTAAGVAINDMGEAVVVGSTASNNFPILHPIVPRRNIIGSAVFVTRFGVDRRSLRTSTILGAGGGLGVAWQADHTLVAGQTGDLRFPVRQPYQDALRGRSDAFVTKIWDFGFVYLPLTLRQLNTLS